MQNEAIKFVINRAHRLLEEEIEAIKIAKSNINEDFYKAVMLIVESVGKIVITGIGKSGHVSRKIAATLLSFGIPAVYLNPAEALHGDLGLVQSTDIVIAISKSGESEEILSILPVMKKLGARIIGITSKEDSTIGGKVDVLLKLGIEREAGYLNLAPTSSVIASLAIGDALATTVAEIKGFKKEDFAMYHPGGAIGASINLNVEDLLTSNSCSTTQVNDKFENVLMELTSKRLGATAVIRSNRLVGIITDGDLKRVLERHREECFTLTAGDIMSHHPIVVQKGAKVSFALELMEKREHAISVIPILDGDKFIGLLRIHDLFTNTREATLK